MRLEARPERRDARLNVSASFLDGRRAGASRVGAEESRGVGRERGARQDERRAKRDRIQPSQRPLALLASPLRSGGLEGAPDRMTYKPSEARCGTPRLSLPTPSGCIEALDVKMTADA